MTTCLSSLVLSFGLCRLCYWVRHRSSGGVRQRILALHHANAMRTWKGPTERTRPMHVRRVRATTILWSTLLASQHPLPSYSSANSFLSCDLYLRPPPSWAPEELAGFWRRRWFVCDYFASTKCKKRQRMLQSFTPRTWWVCRRKSILRRR